MSYPANISNDLGAFEIDYSAESPYMELRAEGYYFNEVTGEVSESPIYLEAIGTSNDSNLNINLFTTITKPRIKKLLAEGQGYSAAVANAQEELLSALGVNLSDKDFTEIDITGGGSLDAALLAYACIIQQDRSISEVVALIQNAASEFETEGKLSAAMVDAIVANRESVNPFEVAHNMAEYYSSKGIKGVGLPPFHLYLDDRYKTDFIIGSASPTVSIMPGGPNFHAIGASYDVLSNIDFDVVCESKEVKIDVKRVMGSYYAVNVHIPENTGDKEREFVVRFVDKAGVELDRRVFRQDANLQVVVLEIGAGTRTSLDIAIEDMNAAGFKEGDVIGVNGQVYALEVESSSKAIVRLPRKESYFFSYPAGSVTKAGHIARVSVDIPKVVTNQTQIPYYAGLEGYHGMEFSNPATVRLRPVVAIAKIQAINFGDISYVELSDGDAGSYVSGKFTYVPNPADLAFYPELNPMVVKGDGKSQTLKYADAEGVFYTILPVMEYPMGLTLKFYDAQNQLLGQADVTNALSLKAGNMYGFRFQKD
jgi:hypothetical protein